MRGIPGTSFPAAEANGTMAHESARCAYHSAMCFVCTACTARPAKQHNAHTQQSPSKRGPCKAIQIDGASASQTWLPCSLAERIMAYHN